MIATNTIEMFEEDLTLSKSNKNKVQNKVQKRDKKKSHAPKITRRQKRLAQRYLDSGLNASTVANLVGTRRRNLAGLSDAVSSKGFSKGDSTLFRTYASQIEVSAFLVSYCQTAGISFKDPPMTTDIDVEVLIATHHFLAVSLPKTLFKKLDINSAYHLIQRFLSREVQLNHCKVHSCRAWYAASIAMEDMATCPVCFGTSAYKAYSSTMFNEPKPLANSKFTTE